MAWPTAQTVITQAALELGLAQSSTELGDDVYALANSNFAQLTALLKRAGRELLDEAEWSQLRAEYSILTESAADATSYQHSRFGAYLLPTDFYEMINQSGWNRTNRLPMGGPLSEQEWSFLASRLTGLVFTVLFQPRNGMLQLYPSQSVPAGQAITFTYKSRNWVQKQATIDAIPTWTPSTRYKVGDLVSGLAGVPPFGFPVFRCVQTGLSGSNGPDPAVATSPYVPTTSGVCLDGSPPVHWNYLGITTSDNWTSADSTATSFGTDSAPTAGADKLMFQEELLVAKLRLLWLKAKGFDSADAERDFRDALATAAGNDRGAPVLNLARGGMVVDKLLGPDNYPITGYGSGST